MANTARWLTCRTLPPRLTSACRFLFTAMEDGSHIPGETTWLQTRRFALLQAVCRIFSCSCIFPYSQTEPTSLKSHPKISRNLSQWEHRRGLYRNGIGKVQEPVDTLQQFCQGHSSPCAPRPNRIQHLLLNKLDQVILTKLQGPRSAHGQSQP